MKRFTRLPFYLIFLQGILFPPICQGTGLESLQRRPPLSLHPQQLGNPSGKAATLDIPHPSSQLVTQLEEYPEQPELQSFNEIIEATQKSAGLFTLYRQKETGKIYLEIKPEQLNKNYFATITMESGIGEQGIYNATSLKDFIFYFRRINNNLLFTVRNVRFRTRPGDPQQNAVRRAFSDSVLVSVPIRSIHPQSQTILIDLGDLLLRDLPDLSSMLAASLKAQYSVDPTKSYFGNAKVFPLNMEIESVYGFSLINENRNHTSLPTLPDRRSLTIRTHYSFSELPENNGYNPRLADDRVGYYTTVFQDFSNLNSNSRFVRYINRWHLEKQDPNAALSLPKKPIVFWIENTVPLEYRDAIKEGVLMWNKAFEKAGFKNAIEVKQMPDNATWDPADIRYNTIRWFVSTDQAFAEGPSRANPLTGEILDADIRIDANMIQLVREEDRIFFLPNSANTAYQDNLCGLFTARKAKVDRHSMPVYHRSLLANLAKNSDICYSRAMANQFSLGAMSLSLLQNQKPNSNEMKEYLDQYVRSLVAHEVGHTLGLKHNFRGSIFLKPEELNNTDITRTRGMVSSVMDYAPVNLAPAGTKQGDYFTSMVGPYDEWAIEYGYKPNSAGVALTMANNQTEKQFLQQIAEKQVNSPELSYAPDEDSADLDPTANKEDLSSDPLLYSQWQLDNSRIMWENLNKNYSVSSNNLGDLTRMFDRVFFYYLRNLHIISKYVGGQSFYRDRVSSANGKQPLEVVSVAKQRSALTMLQKYLFAPDAFNFPPDLLNKLVSPSPNEWDDDDLIKRRLDYPIYNRILLSQSSILARLLSAERLTRLRDIELKTPPGQALTMPELFNSLQDGIWTEVLQKENKSLKISSLRRALQRQYLEILIDMVLRNDDVPSDARSLAWEKLRQLRESLNHTLRKQGKNLDDYTKAHLEETRERITKVLDAQLRSKSNRKT
ncbi:zinc-dependent metalloprotease [Argonema antarcticum]|uniref:zinc-dependent metalloprotease n=1 Tax=Argonema antarcticum TaxID=2942763 RepID=UPI002013BC9A|nr:zinc-dependent metalloprotease [Argonema antarcticum]MCL1472739.1 zinc-dependent metalloprotease [Argonema antarcticum A004/B2]